jgi:hypothetical protein
MYEWYIGPPGFPYVDFVGRHENLVDDLVWVFRRLCCDFNEESLRGHARVNVSQKLCGEPIWDEDLKQKVLALESPAIRRFYGDPDQGDRPNVRKHCP